METSVAISAAPTWAQMLARLMLVTFIAATAWRSPQAVQILSLGEGPKSVAGPTAMLAYLEHQDADQGRISAIHLSIWRLLVVRRCHTERLAVEVGLEGCGRVHSPIPPLAGPPSPGGSVRWGFFLVRPMMRRLVPSRTTFTSRPRLYLLSSRSAVGRPPRYTCERTQSPWRTTQAAPWVITRRPILIVTA
jgi:hypothetical protein